MNDASIDDIWDQPITPSSPKQSRQLEDADDNTQRPSKRPRQALFLADSDDEVNSSHPSTRSAPAEADIDIDIDAMFAEVDNDDDLFAFKPLQPTIDTEALRRDAEARHRRALTSSLPDGQNSLPTDDNNKRSSNLDDGGDDAKEGRKERRRPVKLNDELLLGPQGFPQLIKDIKNFTPKGKGHEASDLNRLIQVYQFWTHRLYPKTPFRETVVRVEKLCHSKRMNVSLSVWRDEFHGLVNGKRPDEDDGDDVIDLTDNIATDKAADNRGSSAPDSDAVNYTPSSPPGTHPPSSASEFEQDIDIDALMREANEASEAETANQTAKGASQAEVDDESLWDVFDDIPAELSTHVQHPTSAPNMNVDEDMWDVVRELENESATKNSQRVDVIPDNASLIPGTNPPGLSEVEEGSEDMYV